MTVHLIWAQAANGVIGAQGTMPWHLPEDLARFRELTTGATVVMGRGTWESLPERFRPLPGRRNVVVTSDPRYDAPGALVVPTIDDALAVADEIWVTGGGVVYAATIDRADRLVVTEVDLSVEGDVVAPRIGPEWAVASADPTSGWHRSATGLRYRWLDYARAARGG